MSNFNDSINVVLKNEGGYADNPLDKGGETNFGISTARYPDLDIRSLTKDDAKKIYKRDFWDKNRLYLIRNQKIANLSLDTIVHHGRGVRILQKALNKSGKNVTVDNKMGPQTRGALNSVAPNLFLNNAVDERVKYMRELIGNDPSQKVFLTGWLRRARSFAGTKTGAGGIIIAGLIIAYFLFRKK